MKKLKLVVSLPNENSYQLEQARAARETAAELGVDVQILFADNDAVTQSQQVLEIVQSPSARPDAILFEPLSATALSRVGEAAVAVGIGWVVLNCDVEYISALRSRSHALAFAVTRDHTEIGRIQARQFAALLPAGGTILYIQGPATSLAAVQRTIGMDSTRPANVKIKSLRSPWTEPGAYEAVTAWLRLSTSRAESIDLVGCQYDGIARGAKKAFEEHPDPEERARWLRLPFAGDDGLIFRARIAAALGDRADAVALLHTACDHGCGPREDLHMMLEFDALRSYPPLERLSMLGFQRRTK